MEVVLLSNASSRPRSIQSVLFSLKEWVEDVASSSGRVSDTPNVVPK